MTATKTTKGIYIQMALELRQLRAEHAQLKQDLERLKALLRAALRVVGE